MALEVEEAFPSFSTERLRSKLSRTRPQPPVVQRRLDYNAPLLSVRSRLTDTGSDVKTKAWKLSSELSEEPLRVPGAVPFTWEHIPGQPKQHVSPPPPSSPSPPSTPSPPSVRRASPASPPFPSPPPLRPLFLRSNSSILFAPPPPPPPPPPPLPLFRPLPPILPRRSNFSKAQPASSPTISQGSDAKPNPDNQGFRGFRLVDPTKEVDFLRLLQIRRRKAEPEEFLTADGEKGTVAAEEVAKVISTETLGTYKNQDMLEDEDRARCPVNGEGDSEPITDNKDAELTLFHNNESCGVVNAIAQKFLEDHPNAGQEATSEKMQEEEQNTEANEDSAHSACLRSNGDAKTAPLQSKDIIANTTAGDLSPQVIFSNQAIEGETTKDKSVQIAVYATSVASEVQSVENKQTLIKKNKHQRSISCTSSIDILDSCRIGSLRMIRNTVAQLCRMAFEASLRTLSKVKRKATPSRTSHEAVVRKNLHAGCSEHEKVKAILQERLSIQSEQQETSSALTYQSRSPAKLVTASQETDVTSSAQPTSSFPIQSASPPQSTTALQETNMSSPAYKDVAASLSGIGSPDWELVKQVKVVSSSRKSFTRHVYAKSIGGDELNEFYDASSRFGSRSSTPGRTTPSCEYSRTYSHRTFSKDWGSELEFLDATSTPFETPRVSISDNKSVTSEVGLHSPTSKVGSCAKPASKLSKRVGKALWVDTREANARDALSIDGFKNFLSGELYTTRRKYVSGDQASRESTRRQYKRCALGCNGNGRLSRPVKQSPFEALYCKNSSAVIAVTPVFPSKCQKNRSMASASGLPRQISTGKTADMGWPLGISGYPPAKTSTKAKGGHSDTKRKEGENNVMVPLPPLPASPAGGSWLRKVLSSNVQLNQTPIRKAGLQRSSKITSPASEPPCKKWENIVKGSHIQPGHLRFSEELHHHPSSNVNSNKYFVS